MTVTLKTSILSLCLIFMVGSPAFAGGLSSTFVQVKLEDLAPGESYNVSESSGKALVVKNTTESTTLDIAVEPEMPTEDTLVPGYEPIPDLSWIHIKKDYFQKVKPGESVKTDIEISIPESKKYQGKKYQVYIYSHTAGKAAMQVGLMGRLLIHTRAKPAKQKK